MREREAFCRNAHTFAPFLLLMFLMAWFLRRTMQRYKELLSHVSAVTRNESSDSVNGILDTVSVSEDLRMVSEVL